MSEGQDRTVTRITEWPWFSSQHKFLFITMSRCSWFHTASYSMGTKNFLMVVKWPQQDADHLPPPQVLRLWNKWGFEYIPCIHLYNMVWDYSIHPLRTTLSSTKLSVFYCNNAKTRTIWGFLGSISEWRLHSSYRLLIMQKGAQKSRMDEGTLS